MECSYDKEANLAKYEGFIAQAAGRGVQLLVFPELSVQGYLPPPRNHGWEEVNDQLEWYRRVAETVPGPTTDRIAQLAKDYNMTIQIGMAECNILGTVLHNSAVIVGPGGLIGVYHKVHNQNEWPVFRPGDALPVFDTPVGRVGAFICTDLHHPECMRAMAIQNAQILTMSTAYPMEGTDPEQDSSGRAYEILGEAAAMANQVWIIQSNQVRKPPRDGAADYYGHSRIISPFGVVANCGYEEALVVASVDLGGELARHRRLWGIRILRRRPELYGILTDRRF